MSVLSDVKDFIESLSVPVETGVFSDEAPDLYAVIIPLVDNFDLHCDDKPGLEIQEARISIYSKSNYQTIKNSIVEKLLENDFTITMRQYIGYESDTHYHHYIIDVEKIYQITEE